MLWSYEARAELKLHLRDFREKVLVLLILMKIKVISNNKLVNRSIVLVSFTDCLHVIFKESPNLSLSFTYSITFCTVSTSVALNALLVRYLYKV